MIYRNTKNQFSATKNQFQLIPKIIKLGVTKVRHQRKFQKYQEAIDCFDKAVSINPILDQTLSNKDKFKYNLSLALHKLKKYADAILCFDQAISTLKIEMQRYIILSYISIQLIHYLNQGTKMKLYNFIWLH